MSAGLRFATQSVRASRSHAEPGNEAPVRLALTKCPGAYDRDGQIALRIPHAASHWGARIKLAPKQLPSCGASRNAGSARTRPSEEGVQASLSCGHCVASAARRAAANNDVRRGAPWRRRAERRTKLAGGGHGVILRVMARSANRSRSAPGCSRAYIIMIICTFTRGATKKEIGKF
jgi:hypothetical protein